MNIMENGEKNEYITFEGEVKDLIMNYDSLIKHFTKCKYLGATTASTYMEQKYIEKCQI